MSENNKIYNDFYCSNCGQKLYILEVSERFFPIIDDNGTIGLLGEKDTIPNVCFFFACIYCGKTYSAIETSTDNNLHHQFKIGEVVRAKSCLLPDKTDCPYSQGS